MANDWVQGFVRDTSTGALLTSGGSGAAAPLAPTGNVTTDTAALEAAIISGRQVEGAFVVDGSLGYSDRCLTMPENGWLNGTGPGRTTITLAGSVNKDLIRTTNYASLLGLSSGVSNLDAMPHSFKFSGVRMLGNFLNNTSGGGIRIVGYDYSVKDVDIAEFRDKGFISEQLIPWTEDLAVDPESSGPLAHIDRLTCHKCVAGGFEFNGPSDSTGRHIYCYLNGPVSGTGEQIVSPLSTTVGMLVNAPGVKFSSCHSWGRNQKVAIQYGTRCSVSSIQQTHAEGAQVAQVQMFGSDCQFEGSLYTGPDFRSAYGIEMGVSGTTAAANTVTAQIVNCEGGGVKNTVGDGNTYRLRGYQGTGLIFQGNLGANDRFDAFWYGAAAIGNSGSATNMAGGGPKPTIGSRVDVAYTLTSVDLGNVVEMTSTTARVLTIPPSLGAPGDQIIITRLNTGAVTVAAGSGVTIKSADGSLTLRSRYSVARLLCRNTDDWYLYGDIPAATSSAQIPLLINTRTVSYTLGASVDDTLYLVEMSSASATVVTVPPSSTWNPAIGSVIAIARLGAGTVAVAAGAGVTIKSPGSLLSLRAQYSEGTLIKRNTDDWYLSGDLA